MSYFLITCKSLTTLLVFDQIEGKIKVFESNLNKKAMYALVLVIMCGLEVVSCRMVSYKHTPHHVNVRSVTQDNTVQDEGQLSQLPDSRCGPVALRCYEPILSYMDSDGEFCGWKNMTSFRALPPVCTSTSLFSMQIWGANLIKYNYKFLKTCDKLIEFQQCVGNNEVCRKDYALSFIVSAQNTFCDDILYYLSVMTCMTTWHINVNWWKLVYANTVIVQACPALHYRLLALNSIKLFLFSYITSPSAATDVVVKSVNAEAVGRFICQYMQQDLCLWKRGDKVCNGYLSLEASQLYYDKRLILLCKAFAVNGGKCNAFVKGYCPLNTSTGHMLVKINFPDITNVYNMTYWHVVGNSEVDILLHTDNKGIGHCDVSNLIFKQIGCFHQYMTQIDINHANLDNYLSEYMCSNIKLYNSCFEVYISSPCPDEASQLQAIGSFLHSQCEILRVANKNVTSPLVEVYSQLLLDDHPWFPLITSLLQHYIIVNKYKRMNPAPSGWREEILYNSDMLITYYKSLIIKGQKLQEVSIRLGSIISAVCDQEAANVYNAFEVLSTGEQYYQLVKYVIKAYDYTKYIVQ